MAVAVAVVDVAVLHVLKSHGDDIFPPISILYFPRSSEYCQDRGEVIHSLLTRCNLLMPSAGVSGTVELGMVAVTPGPPHPHYEYLSTAKSLEVSYTSLTGLLIDRHIDSTPSHCSVRHRFTHLPSLQLIAQIAPDVVKSGFPAPARWLDHPVSRK